MKNPSEACKYKVTKSLLYLGNILMTWGGWLSDTDYDIGWKINFISTINASTLDKKKNELKIGKLGRSRKPDTVRKVSINFEK